ncbi:TetR/AcrR family transcriptional regulator [Hydrogenivirga sp.]
MSVQTRGRLIEAAKRVFSEKGYYNAQISHIIDEAGVARGTFYLYFKSKEEILKELLKEVVEELKERIRVVDLSRDPVEQVVENVERVIEFALEERELTRIVLQRNSDPELFSVIDAFFGEVATLIEHSLRLGIEMGLIRKCNTSLLARAILGALKEIILSLLDREEVDTYVVAREIIELGMRGVWKNAGGESHGGYSAV